MLMHWMRVSGFVVVVMALAACGGGGGGSTTPATVTVQAPAQDIQFGLGVGGVIEVVYTDADPQDSGSTALIADRDGDPSTTADQVVIAADRPIRSGIRQSVSWNVAGAAPGAYKVLALTAGSTSRAVGSAAGMVMLNAAPTLVVTEPATDIVVSRGGMLCVESTLYDPDDMPLSWFALDRDGDASTGDDAHAISVPGIGEPGADACRRLRVTAVPTGSRYRLAGLAWDGTNPVSTALAPGAVTVQNVAWARSVRGTDTFCRPSDIARFGDGSHVLTGTYSGSATFGMGEPDETTLTSAGGTDIFFARYRLDGTLAWAKSAGGPGDEGAQGVDALPDGTVAGTGWYADTATFGPGEAEEAIVATAGQSVYVVRLAADGALLWVRASEGQAQGRCVAARSDGSMLVAGSFSGTGTTFGVGEANETTLTSVNISDIFLARYRNDGALDWIKVISSTGLGQIHEVAVLPDGSSTAAGSFRETLILGPGEANETTVNGTDKSQSYLARFDPDGTFAWVKATEGTGTCSTFHLAGWSDGSTVMTGFFTETATFGAGEAGATTLTSQALGDPFVARYRPDGTLAWARSAAIVGAGTHVATLPDGSILAGGVFSDTGTFGVGEPGQTTFTPVGTRDSFLMRLRGDGTMAWVRAVTSPGFALGALMASAPDGSFVVTGAFRDPAGLGGGVTLDPGTLAETTLPSLGTDDHYYIARYNADGGL